MSLPNIGDTVYIVGKIDDINLNVTQRLVIKVKTNLNDYSDSFLLFLDQVTLIDPADEVEECVD